MKCCVWSVRVSIYDVTTVNISAIFIQFSNLFVAFFSFRTLLSGKSVLMNTVCGKVLRGHISGRQWYTHSCELTSLEQRKAAPIFLSVSLISKLSKFHLLTCMSTSMSRICNNQIQAVCLYWLAMQLTQLGCNY